MHSNLGALPEIVMLVAAAIGMVALFRQMGLSPILGYLTTGILLGPHMFGLIDDVSATGAFGEFGVMFLLFVIGLELSFARLKRMRRHVFGFGSLQVALTGTIAGLIAYAMGLDASHAVLIGGGLSLSSTAIVMQLLEEDGERPTQTGRLSLAVLILQDLAVIPLLMLVPLLAGMHGESIMAAIGEASLSAILGLALIVFIGRTLLRPLYSYIAAHDHQELFSATTLLVVLGTAYISKLAGMPPELGAFVAGLLVAETEFSPQVEADILPFKELLLGVFFISVGMQIELRLFLDHAPVIIGLALAVIVGKAAILYSLSRLFGFLPDTSIRVALLLSQGSEFAFVLFGVAATYGIFEPTIAQKLIAVVALSMALTPSLHSAGRYLAQRLAVRRTQQQQAMPVREMHDLRGHVVIVGFGRVGRVVAKLLEAERIPYVGLDMNVGAIGELREKGKPVFYGDAGRAVVMKAIGITRARTMIITHNSYHSALQAISTAHALMPALPVIARAHNIEEVVQLERAGATLAVEEMMETSLQIGGALLRNLGVGDSEINRLLDSFRAEDYHLTRRAELDVQSKDAAEPHEDANFAI